MPINAIHWADHTRPYPGIPGAAGRPDRQGRSKSTVLSNKADDLTKYLCHQYYLPAGTLRWWQGRGQNIPNKPEPGREHLQLAKQAGISPAEFLTWAIRISIMKTAVGAGMYPIGGRLGFPFRTGTASARARRL